MKSIEKTINLFHKNLKTLNLQPKSKILVAYSGGTDSSVLLDLFMKHCPQMDFTIACAYINHNLRGEDSVEEENFVISQVKENYKIRLFEKKLLEGELEAMSGETIETAARKIRYEFFHQILNDFGYDFIATAHHFDDRIETFFINILRGCGTDGLLSIPVRNGQVIRPILDLTREQIVEYATFNNIKYITDSTNETNQYKRNRIRNEIIPLFKKETGDLYASFKAHIDNVTTDCSFIEEQVNKAFDEMVVYKEKAIVILNAKFFYSNHEAIRYRILKRLFIHFEISSNVGKGFYSEIMNGKRLDVTKGKLHIFSKKKNLLFVLEGMNIPNHFLV